MAPDQSGKSGRSLSPKAIVWIVVAILVVIFIAQNTEKAKIQFLFFDVSIGVWFALLIAFLLGLALGWALPKLRDKN